MSETSSTNGIDPKDASMWATTGNAYFPCESTKEKLDSGQYTIEISQERGLYFNKTKVTLDGLIDLPDSSSDRVLAHIERFWESRDRYEKMDVIYKRGFILYGPPGSGKTTTVQQVSKKIIDRGGVSIYVKDPAVAAKGLEILRRIEPDRPIVVMMEDVDAMIGNRPHDESQLLSLLDGELQIDNVIFIATTNFPEKIPKRLINRPSRFDIIQKIGMPNYEARKTFLDYKQPDIKKEPYPSSDLNEKKKSLSKTLERYIQSKNAKEEEILSKTKELELIEDEVSISKAKRELETLKNSVSEYSNKIKETQLEMDSLKENRTLLDYWAENTEDFSIAHLKELIIAVYCFETDFEDAVNRLKRMNSISLTSKSGDDLNI